MNFSRLKDFDWQAIASLLTAVAVSIALWSVGAEKRRTRRRENHLLLEFHSRINLIKFQASEALAEFQAGRTMHDVKKQGPAFKAKLTHLIDKFHEEGHLITGKGKYRLIARRVDDANAVNELDVISVSAFQLVDRVLGAILEEWKQPRGTVDKMSKNAAKTVETVYVEDEK